MTFPYLLKIDFKSVARVSVESPETQRLRLNDDASVESDAGAVIFVLALVEVDVVGADEEDDVASFWMISGENRNYKI